MKSFKFKSVWLLSHRTKAARHIAFHDNRNLLLGPNHTGKSTVVKHLFITLGATPAGTLDEWDDEAVSAVDFELDGKPYRALHQKGARALFSDRTLLLATTKHSEWAQEFASISGFNLLVTDSKTGEPVTADPACFFLPFVIDQDGSWGASWHTFPSIRRFRQPVKDILDYFSGIRPPQFYVLQAERNALRREAEHRETELRVLERARDRLSDALPKHNVKLDAAAFEQEIAELTNEAENLERAQHPLRRRVFQFSDLAEGLRLQIAASFASLREHDNDREYLKRLPKTAVLVCPTCAAEHHHSFIHDVAFAEDARTLEELVRQLNSDLAEAERARAAARQELAALDANYLRINALLETRRGDLQFSDVVRDYGAQAAHGALLAERNNLAAQLAEVRSRVATVDAELKVLEDRKRAHKILREFRERYAEAREALRLSNVNVSRSPGLTSRPAKSGSGGPRLVLAYYSALWHVCSAENCVPVVIDSPNQQDQDAVNLPAIINFIAESVPTSSQMIVCLTSPPNASFDRVLELNDAYGLLQESQYGMADAEIGPEYVRMNEALLTVGSW